MQKCKYDVDTSKMTSMCNKFAYILKNKFVNMTENGCGGLLDLDGCKYYVGIDYCPFCGKPISDDADWESRNI